MTQPLINYETEPMTLQDLEIAFGIEHGPDIVPIAFAFSEEFDYGYDSTPDLSLDQLLAMGQLDAQFGFSFNPFKAVAKAVTSVGKAAGGVLKGAAKVATTIANSKLVKATVAGAAIVCPAIGVPMAAALATTAMVAKAANSVVPAKRAAARTVITNTAKLAQSGNKDAAVALSMMATHADAAKAQAARAVVAKQTTPIAPPVRPPAVNPPARIAPVIPINEAARYSIPSAALGHRIIVDIDATGRIQTSKG